MTQEEAEKDERNYAPLDSALLALRPNAIAPILALSLAQVDWTVASSSTRVPPFAAGSVALFDLREEGTYFLSR